MNFMDYVEQILTELQNQKESLFTNKIRLSKNYANMHVNESELNEDEKNYYH